MRVYLLSDRTEVRSLHEFNAFVETTTLACEEGTTQRPVVELPGSISVITDALFS